MSVSIRTPDLELLDLATRVAVKWLAEPTYTLKYMTAANFKVLVDAYTATFQLRQNVGDARNPITAQLNALDKRIDGATKFLKDYLKEKYDSTTTERALYPQFGIEKVGNTFKLPTDRNSRRDALRKLLIALVAEGFDARKYGTAFWLPIVNSYDQLAVQAVSTDGSVSISVATKLQQKKEIAQVLVSLQAIVAANNPDTFKGELRSWGFQKEKM